MTDQTMPADKVERIAAAMRAAMRRDDPYYSDGAFLEDMSRYIRDLEDLLPDPPLPTLADMTPEERAACQWMQADVEGYGTRCVIASLHDDGDDTGLVPADGGIVWASPGTVTPRPDLPRMEWPSDKKPAPAPTLPDGWRLADHEDYGRGIVTNTTTNRDGRVYFVIPADDPMGYDWFFCDPEELTYLEQ